MSRSMSSPICSKNSHTPPPPAYLWGMGQGETAFELSDVFPPRVNSLKSLKPLPCDKSKNSPPDREPTKEEMLTLGHRRIYKRISGCRGLAVHFKSGRDDRERDRHRYSDIYCNCDFCPACSAKDSPSHRRRKYRTRRQLGGLLDVDWNLVVVTIEPKYRHRLTDRDTCNKVRKAIWEIIAEMFKLDAEDDLDRGGCIQYWHWFGDKPSEDLDSHYHPHVNTLFPCIRYRQSFEAGVPVHQWKKFHKDMRQKLAHRLGIIFGADLDYQQVNWRFEKKTTMAQKNHAIHYICRSTINGEAFANKTTDHEKLWLLVGKYNYRNVVYRGILSPSWVTKDVDPATGKRVKMRDLWLDQVELKRPEPNSPWVDQESDPYEFVKVINANSKDEDGNHYNAHRIEGIAQWVRTPLQLADLADEHLVKLWNSGNLNYFKQRYRSMRVEIPGYKICRAYFVRGDPCQLTA